jgi:feruloyl esterase
VAQFTGSGDWRDGANYTNAAPRYNVPTPQWPGSFLYTPYTPKQQGVTTP